MQVNKIGVKLSLFWIAWAFVVEKLGNFSMTDKIFQKGLKMYVNHTIFPLRFLGKPNQKNSSRVVINNFNEDLRVIYLKFRNKFLIKKEIAIANHLECAPGIYTKQIYPPRGANRNSLKCIMKTKKKSRQLLKALFLEALLHGIAFPVKSNGVKRIQVVA